MILTLQRGGGVLIRKPVDRGGIVKLLRFLGVPESEFVPSIVQRRKAARGYRGSGFYQHNAGRLEWILHEANRAWKQKVRELGDVRLCRELNDAWNRVKHLLRQAMNPKLFLPGQAA